MYLPRLAVSLLASFLAGGTIFGDEPRALQPAPLPALVSARNTNQQVAEAIAQQLRASRQLRGYRIEVNYSEGTAELSGFAGDADQVQEAIRLAHGAPGVNRVLNRLGVGQSEHIAQTQLPVVQETAPLPRPVTPEAIPQDPLPSYRARVPAYATESLPPPLPPYAWPTYAPHNNYSRVAYPTSYPYEAFPFIGPVHPFPKAPLSWRSVKLEFDDGHWWPSTHAQQRDGWFLRYW